MRFSVSGVDAESGEERTVEVGADSERDALCAARGTGMLPYQVTCLSEPQPSAGTPEQEDVYARLDKLSQNISEYQRMMENPTRDRRNQLIILIGCAVPVLILLLIGYGVFSGPPSYPPPLRRGDTVQGDKAIPITMAQDFVKARLKSPSSASFPWSFDKYQVTEGQDGHWSVSGYVDATNSFNAHVRTRWSVEMTASGSNWELVSINISE
jgi:hypothetical protein